MSQEKLNGTFGQCLQFLLFEHGARPEGSPEKPGRTWGQQEFADAVGVSARTVRYWLNDEKTPNDLVTIERELLRGSSKFDDWKRLLRAAYQRSRNGPASPPTPQHDVDGSSVHGEIIHPAITPVPNFTGRADDLAKLDAALWADAPGGDAPAHIAAITQTAAVHGLGGIGKSVLARHYAYENRARYAGVWSFAAETAAGIEDGLIELGAHRIPGLAQQENRAAAAREALRMIESSGAEKPWLLIYDNIEKPDALNGLTPRSGAHILITTRWHNWQGRAKPLELGKFSEEEAIGFLLSYTGRTDRDGAARLADALGYLPLALDHAAAFCFDGGISFDAYRAQLADWLDDAPEGADYPRAVFATFNLAIEKAAAEEPMAETLMGLLAFMAPDDFPREIIPEEVIGGHALSKAVMALRKLSLIAVKEDAQGGALLGVHRLVQHVMRARLEESGAADEAARAALAIVANAFPYDSDDVRNWPACEHLLPHAMTLLSKAADQGEGAEKISLLCNQLALYQLSRADHKSAEPLMCRALAIDEAAYGPDHPTVAIRLNNLAVLLEEGFGKYDESEKLKRRALAIDEAAYGPDHPSVAIRLNNLAQLLQATNRLDEAEPLMHRALAIVGAAYGPDHPRVAIHLNNLALLLKATNRLAEAEPLMRRALAIDEAAYGLDHPRVAIDLNNLAQLLQDTNRLAEAEPLMRRALAIDEAAYGPEHPDVAFGLNNLARLLQDTNRLAEAEPLMRRALEIFEASLGPDHPKTQTVQGNLDALLAAMGAD